MVHAVIRTLTLGLADAHPISPGAVETAVDRLRAVRKGFEQAGYEVQTVRLGTRPVFEPRLDDLPGYCRGLQSTMDDAGLGYLSLGPAPVASKGYPLDQLAVIEEVLCSCPGLSCSVMLSAPGYGVRHEALLPVATTIRNLAERSPGGEANFRFAGVARVGPGHPFFPASYHSGPHQLTIGLQGAPLVTAALAELAAERDGPVPGSRLSRIGELTARVRGAVRAAAEPIVVLGQRLAGEAGVEFGGIDLSPAPSPQCSIAEGIEAVLGARFGAPGTIAVVAAITAALHGTALPTCGYNGLMLPVLEDPVLADAWSQGRLSAHELLACSALCGTGLDTVPLPGDVAPEDLAGLLLDVTALAEKLDKPLSARLFPVPGKGSGDVTEFSSPHLINIRLP